MNNHSSPKVNDDGNNPKSPDVSNQNEKLDTKKNNVIKKEEENNISTSPQEKNNIHISLPDESIYLNKFLQYLKKTKKIYEKCPTPVLDYLISSNGELKMEYFGYKYDKDSYIDHLYDNLKELINNLKNGDFTTETQGYFCFKDESTGAYIETLYSNVELKLLFNKITSNENFPKDDFMNPDDIKAKNVFKSRALSFEYYINYSIIIDKFKMKERPRVFYPFKSLEAIKKMKKKRKNQII